MLKLLGVLLTVDIMFFLVFIYKAAKANWDKRIYIDNHYWCAIGGMIIFHVIMGIIALVYTYIHFIVHATL